MVHAVGSPLIEGRPIVANLSSIIPHLGVRALPGPRPILFARSNLDGRSNPCVQGRTITSLLSGQDPALFISNWFMRRANCTNRKKLGFVSIEEMDRIIEGLNGIYGT
jgi:hypothetical protein